MDEKIALKPRKLPLYFTLKFNENLLCEEFCWNPAYNDMKK